MIFTRIINDIRAATPDNPRFSLNDPQAWDVFLGGQPAVSGVRVTRETALTYAPWWRGVNLIAGDVAKLPLNVCKLVNETSRPDPTHPAWPFLRRKPSDYSTAFTFKEVVTGHAITQGNGYAYIERDGAGRILALLVLDPIAVTPVRENGRLLYVVEAPDLDPRKVPAEDMLHIRGFSPDGLQGYSVFDKARESIGLGIGARKFGSVFLRNNARPNVALEVPKSLTETQLQDLRKGWEGMQGGLENAHRVAIIQGGAKLVPFSINATDAQLIETRQFEIREVALWIGVPPHKLGDSTKASYNSLEQENQDYLDTGLDPWLVRWEEESRDKLLTDEEKADETHDVIFDRKRLIRADMTGRSNYYQKATGNRPWMTPDEVRAEEGMEPQGGDAATLKDPLNMGSQPPADTTAPEPPPPKPPKKDKGAKKARRNAAIRAVVEDAGRRMVRRLGHAAKAAAKKPAAWDDWLATLEAEHRPVFVEAFTPAALLIGAEPSGLTDCLYVALKKALHAFGDTCTPATLAEQVERYFVDMEATLPVALARELVDGKKGKDDGR